jgi:hypothetical protein
MNEQKQRTAIAKACGWTQNKRGSWVDPSGRCVYESWGPTYPGAVPPYYLEDLNAMHEAEKTLEDRQHQYYYRHLEEIQSGCPYEPDSYYGAGWIYHNVHAIAAQRAEAFLKTLGLWEDDN